HAHGGRRALARDGTPPPRHYAALVHRAAESGPQYAGTGVPGTRSPQADTRTAAPAVSLRRRGVMNLSARSSTWCAVAALALLALFGRWRPARRATALAPSAKRDATERAATRDCSAQNLSLAEHASDSERHAPSAVEPEARAEQHRPDQRVADDAETELRVDVGVLVRVEHRAVLEPRAGEHRSAHEIGQSSDPAHRAERE